MIIEEIQAALAGLVVKMGKKGVITPVAHFTVQPNEVYVYLTSEWREASLGGRDSKICKGKNPFECFTVANAFINALPSPEEVVTREYLTRVASAVDYATEHSLPDEYVAPLRGVSAAMTSNLLTKETA